MGRAPITRTLIRKLAQEFAAPPGRRGGFEPLFKDHGKERGGWVHRVAEVLASRWPEEIAERACELQARGFETLGFIAMGGESSILGPTDAHLLSVSTTAPAAFKRLLAGRDLRKIYWFIVSKSGATRETLSNAAYLERCHRHAGLEPHRFITYVTDPSPTGNPFTAKTGEGFHVEHRELGGHTTVGRSWRPSSSHPTRVRRRHAPQTLQRYEP